MDVINIGRPGPWGNPFKVGQHGTRDECVIKFAQWLERSIDVRARWMRSNIETLRGKDLWCPGCQGTSPCHRDVFKQWLRERSRP